MSTENDEPGHGHSPAAWTGVTIMLIGFALGTLFFFLVGTVDAFSEMSWLVWAGAGIVLLGLIAGGVMAKLGYGAKSGRTTGSH